MRVMVTGGAGYIGSHTLLELLAAGHEPMVIDNLSNGHQEALRRVTQLANRDFDFAQIDIRDASALNAAFAQFKPEAVIHFAGLKAVGESVEKPLLYYDNNVVGSLRLLEAMDRVACRLCVFSSSATVYGDPRYLPLDEDHPTQPVNPYGHTKLMVENILRDWAGGEKRASALRYFNPVGAHASGHIGEDPHGIPNNLMPYISQVAIGTRSHVEIFGNDYETRDGTGERDYIHVVDLARAHVAALDTMAHRPHFDVLNVGTGKGTTVTELISAFATQSQTQIATQIGPRRPGDVASSIADPTKIHTVTAWRAEHDINDATRSSWNWQSRNPHGYQTS